jgi:serine/threonine protein kinase
MSWMKENVDAERATTQLLQTQCGTAKYMAPETIVRSGKGYDGEKVDAWECGMVLYALLAGYLPFNGEDDNSVFQSILRGKLKFPSHFSPGAKDVLRRLLEKDPAKRMTLPEVREHLWFLVDYKGDAAKKPAASFVLANIPSTKTKLGQSFKKSKSRGRLSQRILQGALKIETISPPAIDLSAAVSLVPQRPRNKSTVRFVRDAPSPSNNDQVSWEQIVDAEGRCDGPRSDMPLTPEDSDVCDSPVACPSRESRDSTADTVPGGAPTAVATSGDRPCPGDESAVTGTVVTSGAISVESVKKQSRMTGATNILKVPSLGFFFSDSQRPGAPKGNETYPDSDVAGSPNSPVEGDVDALVSLRSRLKTPLSSMLKSMLSTSSDCQTPEAGMNDRFTAQSSWFASSPTSDAASPTFAQAIDHMMSEENVADAKVTSFKFLKRPKASPRKRGDVLVTTGQVQK